MRGYELFFASPTPKAPKRGPRQNKSRNLRSRAALKFTPKSAAIANSDTEDEQDDALQVPENFRVKDLPRELRCIIWQEVLLNDNVFELENHPSLLKFGEDKPSRAVRRCIPGYFRPTALLTRHEELMRHNYQQVYMINRTPPLFFVSKDTYIEAREVAFRHVVLEIDKPICGHVLDKWTANMDNMMLQNMRNLYLCTHATVAKSKTWVMPMAFSSNWPMLDIDHQRVPLFHLAISPGGTSISIAAQRELVLADSLKLDAGLKEWQSKLPQNDRFSPADLVDLASVIQHTQMTIFKETWTLKVDEQDEELHKETAKAQKDLEWKTGAREFEGAWMTLEPDFRAPILRLSAPSMVQKSKGGE